MTLKNRLAFVVMAAPCALTEKFGVTANSLRAAKVPESHACCNRDWTEYARPISRPDPTKANSGTTANAMIIKALPLVSLRSDLIVRCTLRNIAGALRLLTSRDMRLLCIGLH
ncbi:hypothetical protein IP81_12600 [Novosphingobium sp. AAP83]|nr:hypothetical protein IP81_12600 [Novosphingobium sp. AAP83]